MYFNQSAGIHYIRKMANFKTTSLFKCLKCELSFLSKEGMEKHSARTHGVETHVKVTKFRCEHCNETFSSKPDLNSHRLKQRLLCKKCQEDGKTCISENKCELLKHVRSVHKNELWKKNQGKSLECKRCHKVLKTAKQMKTHQETHSMLACTKCGKKLEGFCNLELHLKTNCNKTDKSAGKRPVMTEDQLVGERNIKREKETRQTRRKYKKKPIHVPHQTEENNTKTEQDTAERPEVQPDILRSPLDEVDFFYPTWTAQQLTAAGIFTPDSPFHFVLPVQDSEQICDIAELEQSDMTCQEFYEPPPPIISNEVILGF